MSLIPINEIVLDIPDVKRVFEESFHLKTFENNDGGFDMTLNGFFYARVYQNRDVQLCQHKHIKDLPMHGVKEAFDCHAKLQIVARHLKLHFVEPILMKGSPS